MSTTPREIGTLVVVILKAQHLPNKRHIGKQDPYCCVTLDGDKRRTRAIKRGGQHPEWDEEVRFTLYEDTEDMLARIASEGGTPPPLPPKDTKKKKKVKGGNAMMVACYADDPKEPELIGETLVDLTEVLTKGETDEWFTLLNKDKFSGEVYLELTFWSNEKPPEKKSKPKPTKSNRQYGGPGSFVPSESENGFSNADRNSIPSSLRSSSSLAQLDLYIPPYESANARTVRSQGTGSTVDQVADEFGGLSVGPGSGGLQKRRDSYPLPQRGHTPRQSDTSYSTLHTSSSYHSTGYSSGDYSDPGSSYSYDYPSTPVPRTHSNSFGESNQPYVPYQSPYDPNPGHTTGYSPSHTHAQPDYGSSMYSVPSASSGFVPVATPAPSGFAPMHTGTPAPSGFMPPASHTPVSFGYAQHPSQTPDPFGYGPPPSHTPTPSGFAPPPSSMGYHQTAPLVQSYLPYQQYPPQPSPAPPMQYMSTGPPTAPPPSHSAPPQQYSNFPSPSLSNMSQQYPTYAQSTPSPPQQQYNPSPPVAGSRPLPTPGVQNGSFPPATPPHPIMPTPPHTASPMPHGTMVYANTPPHAQSQSHPLPTPPGPPSQPPANVGPPPSTQSNGFIPPPPPPPLSHSRLSGPPPPPPTQFYQQQGSSPEAQNGRGQSPARPPLPQPPTNAGSTMPFPPLPHLQPGSGFQPPPPPPPLARRTASQSQHPLPQPPAVPPRGVKPGEIYSPGPPPRPPAQVVYDNSTGFWNGPSQ
ncbi:hypothetical protein DFH11DRAFT_340326 [Phellopilus nigrolimitatus]|nr:hypothetical protein DFH11DRAFT_340326 [Phellopilus nigrolimitatus]